MTIVFIPALYLHYEKYGYALNQYDAVAMPVYKELLKAGIDTKWGTWNDEADIYVCTNPYKFGKNVDKLVYCPDGLGLQEAVYQGFGGILFPGPYWRQIFEENRGKTTIEGDPCYPLIGWPPLDLWFNSEGKEKEEQLREELKLPYEKTIMFGGLYDGRGGFISEYMKRAINNFLDGWENRAPVNVIYKGHVISTINFTQNQVSPRWVALKARMDKLPYCNFIDPLTAGNIFDYALVSDVLVSGEGCTALTAYMAVGIPTIQLGMRWYTDIRSKIGESYIGVHEPHIFGFSHSVTKFRSVPQIFMPGFVSDVHALPGMVNYAYAYPDKYRAEEKAFLEKILYKVDGKTSKRAADAILAMRDILS